MADSGNASSAGTPSAPTGLRARAAARPHRPGLPRRRMTPPARRPRPSAARCPFPTSACSTAGKIEPRRRGGGGDADHLRAGGAELHGGRRLGEVRRHHPQRRLARGMHQAAGAGNAQAARSSTTRTGERASMPGSRQVSSGSSASTVPMPTRMASHCARSRCTRVLRGLAGDRDRLVAGGADLVVGGDRELEDHVRAPVADAAEMPGMIARGFRGAKTDIDRDARRRAVWRGPGRPLPDWDPRSPTPRAQCRRRSRHRRKAATCRNANRAPASHRAWRRARPRRRA